MSPGAKAPGFPETAGTPIGFGDVNGDGAPDMVVLGPPYVYRRERPRRNPGAFTSDTE